MLDNPKLRKLCKVGDLIIYQDYHEISFGYVKNIKMNGVILEDGRFYPHRSCRKFIRSWKFLNDSKSLTVR